MSLLYYRTYFNSEEEYNQFKLSSPSLVGQANGLYQSLINNGYSDFIAQQIVAKELYSSFAMAFNQFRKINN